MTEKQQTPAKTGGRPRNPANDDPDMTPEQRAKANLQYTMDRACNFIADGTASVLTRGIAAAKAGVPRETVETALAAVGAALADARTGIARAYEAPDQPAERKSRVQL